MRATGCKRDKCSAVAESLETAVVYALRSPDDCAIRYVGQTGSTLAARLRGHVQNARRYRAEGSRLSPKDQWVLALFDAGKRPTIEALGGNLTEPQWIAKLAGEGVKLLNCVYRPGWVPDWNSWDKTNARRAAKARGELPYQVELRAARVARRLTPTIKGFLLPVPGLPRAALLDLSEPQPLTAAGLRASWQPAGDPR